MIIYIRESHVCCAGPHEQGDRGHCHHYQHLLPTPYQVGLRVAEKKIGLFLVAQPLRGKGGKGLTSKKKDRFFWRLPLMELLTLIA